MLTFLSTVHYALQFALREDASTNQRNRFLETCLEDELDLVWGCCHCWYKYYSMSKNKRFDNMKYEWFSSERSDNHHPGPQPPPPMPPPIGPMPPPIGPIPPPMPGPIMPGPPIMPPPIGPPMGPIPIPIPTPVIPTPIAPPNSIPMVTLPACWFL